MADDQDRRDDDFDDADAHFDDADLEAMLENLEEEFRGQDDHTSDAGAPDADGRNADEDPDDTARSFEDELEGLLGAKAKAALICTRLTSAELLAAFCQLSDISADCIGTPEGAVAALHNLDGDGPEAAVKDLTKVVSGLSALLVVNRADKLETTVYYNGEAGEQLPPPFVFPSLAPFVEDVMLGIVSIDDVAKEHDDVVASDAIDHDKAFQIIAKHTHLGNGPASIE